MLTWALPSLWSHIFAFTSVLWLLIYVSSWFLIVCACACVCVCVGEGQVCLQDPPAWNSGAAEEVQCQAEAEGQHRVDAYLNVYSFKGDYLELRGSNTSYTGCICFWPEWTSCLYFLRFLTGLSSCGFIYKAFIYTTQHEALSRLYLIAVLSLLCIPGCSSGCCFQPQV